MRKRTLAALLALTAVVALVAIVPRTPPGRAWLLGRVTSALSRAGVDVHYRSSAGNLWTGVELDGARVDTPGMHLSIRSLRLRYFLPSLISGDLPLSVTLAGVRGSVDASRLASAGAGAGGLPVRPRLQEVTVSDASVEVQQVPYTIPSGAVSHVRIRQQGSSLAVEAQLTTSDGSAVASGTLDLSGPRFDGRVVQADARLARHWFPGATAGTLSGPIHAGPDGVRAELSLQGGALDAIGLHPQGIQGSIQLRYPLIHADLRGHVLGGDVAVQGVVNVAGRHWTAQAHGNPQLLAAAEWLAGSSVPGLGSLPLEGTATTTLDASGWTRVRVSGEVSGAGTMAGLPLDELQASYRYDSVSGVKVQATGRVAGGAAVVTAATGPRATTIEAGARRMAPVPGQSVDLQAHLELAAGGASGSVHLSDDGTVAGRPVALSLEAGLNGDGWQAVLQGSDAAGATFGGALALSGGRVSGELHAGRLRLPGLDRPLTATLRADGPAAALPVSVTLGADGPLQLQLGPERLAADLRGTLHATLAGAAIRDLQASLGPLQLAGNLDLAPLQGTVSATLAETALQGPLRSQLKLSDGRATFTAAGIRPAGTLSLADIRAGPVRASPLALDLGAPASGSGLQATARDQGLRLELGHGLVQASFRALQLRVAGVSPAIDGTLAVPLGQRPLDRLTANLDAAVAGASLGLHGTGGRIVTTLTAARGTRIGPLALAQQLTLAGTADASAGHAALSGRLGDVPLSAAGDWGHAPDVSLVAGSGPQALRLSADSSGWGSHGRLELAALANAVGLPLRGVLTTDLQHRSAGYTGRASLDATAPATGTLTLRGSGDALDLALDASLLGQPLRASGTLSPRLDLSMSAGPVGPVALANGQLNGSGALAPQALAAGFELRPLLWQLHGSLSPLRLTLDLGDHGRARLDGASLAARLSLPLSYGGMPLRLKLATAGSGATVASVGAANVRVGRSVATVPLTATLEDADGTALAHASGTAAGMSLTASLPARLLGARLPGVLEPAGRLALTGSAHLTAPARYQLDGSWTAGSTRLAVVLSGTPSGGTASLQGDGMSLTVRPGQASLSASDASLAPFFPHLPLAPILNGALTRQNGAYSGALRLRVSEPSAHVDAVLRGEGGRLLASASGAMGPADLTLQGQALPTPDLSAHAGALNGGASLTARATGSWRALDLTGTLTTAPLDAAPWLSMPSRTMDLRLQLASGALTASGDGIDLHGTVSDVNGTVSLPLHALGASERLRLAVSGPLAGLALTGEVAGSAVRGTLAGTVAEGLRASLTVPSASLSSRLPLLGNALTGDLHLTGEMRPSGDWNASAAAAVTVSGARLPLRAQLRGSGTSYRGALTLASDAPTPDARAPAAASPLLSATIVGNGAALRAGIDLAGVDTTRLGRLLGVPMHLSTTGELRLTTRPTTASLTIDAHGTTAGRPLSVAGHAGPTGVTLDAAYAGLEVHLEGGAGAPLGVTVGAPAAGVRLRGTLALGGSPAVTLSGEAKGARAAVRLALDPSRGSGTLHGQLGAASLRASLVPSGTALALTLDAQAPAGALAPLGLSVGGNLAATADYHAGRAALDSLTLDLAGAPTPASLTLAGPVYPAANLRGTLSAPAWQLSGGVSLAGPPGALDAGLTLESLSALAQIRGGKLAMLSADGHASLGPAGARWAVTADRLSWRPDAGFRGAAGVRLAGGLLGIPGEVNASLDGHGPLAVTATAGPAGGAWARLDAQLAPRPLQAQAWQGALRLDLPVLQLAGLPVPRLPLTLAASPSVSGPLLSPSLDGPATLTGVLGADGTLAWHGATGKLTLTGPHVTLDAGFQGASWSAKAALDGAPLDAFTPVLTGGRASLQAAVRGGPGRTASGDLSHLLVTVPGASVSGTATLQQGIRAALQLRADLSQMSLPGPTLRGQIHGPVVLAAPRLDAIGDGTLIAMLDVAGLSAGSIDGGVDGTLQLGGTPAEPVASAVLTGSGSVSGQLRANAAAASQRLELTSTLSYQQLSTDLSVTLQQGRAHASGSAAWGDAKVSISTTPSGAVVVDGAQALAGWRAAVDPTLANATVAGPLSGLGTPLTGRATVKVGGTPWLAGDVSGAAVAGVPLGDVRLTAASAGAPVELRGAHLAASVDPNGLGWRAHVNAQPLPGGISVSGDASGRGGTGNATLTTAGSIAGEPASVTVTASSNRGLALDASGRLLGGSLTTHLDRVAGSGWQGTLSLQQYAVAGLHGSLHGTLTSAGAGPTFAAGLDVGGALSGSASVAASPAGTRLKADLSGAVIGGELTLAGSLAPALDLRLAGTPAAGAQTEGARGALRLFQANGALRGEGALRLAAGPARVSLSGSGAGAPLAVGAALPAIAGLALEGTLPTTPPLALLRSLARDGLVLRGVGHTKGQVQLSPSPAPSATLQALTLDVAGTRVSGNGTLTPTTGDVRGAVVLPSDLPIDQLGGASIPYRATWRDGRLTLTSDGPTGSLQAELRPGAGSGHVAADLHTLGSEPGQAKVDLSFDPAGGPSGSVILTGLTVSRPRLPSLTLSGNVTVGSGAASGRIDLQAPHGGLRLDGSWGLAGLLPAALTPGASSGGNAEARVNTFDLATLPTLQRLVPHLKGKLSGVVRFRNETVVGELLSADLRVAGTPLPLDAQVSGTLGALDARVKLGASLITATLLPGEAKGLLRFQRFPAQLLAEASTGATDVTADVDGVMRFDVPYADPAASYLRMATQQVKLERAGVVTTGSVSWVYDNRALTIENAAFEGRGSWEARGMVDASTLDLQLSARNADFTPLLGLVPVLARYGVGASGSFTLNAQGSPADPDITLEASGLEARVAGTHYRLENASTSLKGDALSATAHVVGVAPFGGSVDVKGKAALSLTPLELTGTDFRFSGNAELPVVGTVTHLSGGITQPQGKQPQLDLAGSLGRPFTIRGSLSPFDVRVKGTGLDLKASPLFITSSTVDANVRLRGTRKGLSIGGELDATQVHMNIGAPAAPAQQPSVGAAAPPATASAPARSLASPGPPASGNATSGHADTTPGAAAEAANAARQSVLFDHLHLKAPQRVLLDAGFGTAEASLDLTLDGTAAQPQLDGTAKALRGTLTFAGRDFTIDRATATFQASRGVYPALDVQAHTEFDKRRVLSGTNNLTFTAPRNSSTFGVTLTFSGQVQPSTQGPSPVRFDIQPALSSDALVQASGDTGAGSPRPLSDAELLSLVTLGRLDVTPQLAGQGSFGTAVAQSALDTAVDVLVVSELQNALSKALGIDVVQIQTTPLSSLLENSGQPFGVSLRLGGYLTPELFASYRLGNYNGVSGSYGFSNEVSLSYDLGPLNLDLSGRLSFPESPSNVGAVPELGLGLSYAFTNNLGLEAGIDLSDLRKQARFGVSVHW